MKVIALRNTRASGKQIVKGKEYDLGDADAKYLIQIGKAKSLEKAKPKKPGSDKD